MTEFIDVQQHDGWLGITLQRPKKYNALTLQMYDDLAALIRSAQADERIKAVVISGGEHCFTSGNDLQDFLGSPPECLDAPAFRFMDAVIDLDKPLIAAVCGAAIGIGTTLLPHCDLVYASVDCQFATPFIKLGLCQEFGASLLFPQRLGHGRAAQLILAGESLDARTALDWGLCTHLFDTPAQCLAAATAQAERFAKASLASLQVSKRLLKSPLREPLKAVVREENLQFIARLQSEEAKAQLLRMLEKRK
ncbi:enoyl-CoA hydratase-related protein [Pseudomonas asiatica]|uniref:enoyl-CoA hydratase-related protein n=1 Tax=Pseudomonas asiatica TaxID=2219225 RepID=UPI002E7AEE94|nr:enoyl-CoA hydratase-related protein [Pseudomonas asiatica]MEE1916293.1 enoyl-CoA hydratase-related protein [Pseudomonas asiatica]